MSKLSGAWHLRLEASAYSLATFADLEGQSSINKFHIIKALMCREIEKEQAIYESTFTHLIKIPHIGPSTANKILTHRSLDCAKHILTYCTENHIQLISFQDTIYPTILHLYMQSPTLLYVKGDLKPLNLYPVATTIVGARRCNTYGKEVYVLPGNIYDPLHAGSHALFLKGAKPYVSIASNCTSSVTPTLPATHKKICKLLQTSSLSIDQLHTKLQLDLHVLEEALLSLELNNILYQAGGYIHLNKMNT